MALFFGAINKGYFLIFFRFLQKKKKSSLEKMDLGRQTRAIFFFFHFLTKSARKIKKIKKSKKSKT